MAEFSHDPVAVGIGSAAITGALAWLGQRMIGKAALETALRETTKEILEQLRTELRVAIHERDDARGENAELRAKVEELQRTIRALGG